MIISNIICNRWVGHEYGDWRSRIDRYICPLIIACEAYLWTVFNWQVALLAGLGFAVWRYDGWGEANLAMHGSQIHYANRNRKKWVTKLADAIYTPNGTNKQRKLYGIIWGGIRGLYDLPAFIAVAVLFSNPLIAALGLLMGLQGAVYYLSGKLFPSRGTPPAELIMGAFRGSLWLGALYGNFISAR
jgi:hypothetical protein